jgi:hypothetical protein
MKENMRSCVETLPKTLIGYLQDTRGKVPEVSVLDGHAHSKRD